MYFQPARILLEMNINRLIAISILTIASFILFIYPDPDGSIYDILNVIVFILIVVALYQYSISENGSVEINETNNNEESASGNQSSSIHENLQVQYKQLLNVVFNMISAINENYNAAFYMLNDSGKTLNIQFSRNDIFRESINIENDLVQAIMNQSDAMLIQQSDIRSDWNELFMEKTWRGSECALGSRVLYKDTPMGCLIIQTDHFSHISERDKEMLTSISHFVSIGMVKLDNIEKLSFDIFFHNQIASLLNSLDIHFESDNLYKKVRDLCRTSFSYDKLTITNLHDDGEHFKVVLEDGYTGDVNQDKIYSITGSLFGNIYRTKETLISSNVINDFNENGRFIDGDLEKVPFNSMLSVPILVNGKVLSSLTLERQGSHQFSKTDKNLLELLASTIALILTWQHQYLSMKDNAMHDGLTGLLNHKAFLDRFKEETSRANRYNHSIVFAILDLDKFKRINDSYGHLYGDYVIREVARIIKENVRTIDVVGRYGGEEYAILMINTTVENIITVAHRIIEKIATYPFKLEKIDVKMTISCGLSEYPNDADNVGDLISKADEAMYDSKAKGGNHVTIYSEQLDRASGSTLIN